VLSFCLVDYVGSGGICRSARGNSLFLQSASVRFAVEWHKVYSLNADNFSTVADKAIVQSAHPSAGTPLGGLERKSKWQKAKP
jgi:hypothetical protein